jgi:hypothetical protein
MIMPNFADIKTNTGTENSNQQLLAMRKKASIYWLLMWHDLPVQMSSKRREELLAREKQVVVKTDDQKRIY